MKHIPRILNSAVVRLFAVLDHTVPAPSNPLKPPEQNPLEITQLAICQRFDQGDYALFYCDSTWRALRQQSSTTLDEAIQIADRDYPGSALLWLDPIVVSRLPHEAGESPHCAFCNTAASAIVDLIAGKHACICHDCIDRLYHQYHSSDRRTRVTPARQNQKYRQSGSWLPGKMKNDVPSVKRTV